MKITCQSCGAKYAIADEKVRGRRVKVRCKGCNEPIVVDGYSEPAQDEYAAAPAGGGGAADDSWSVNLTDTDQRSMTTSEIVDAWNAGHIPADAFVWKEGMDDWVPLASAPDLTPYLSAAQHSAPAQPDPPPAFDFSPPAAAGGAARVERSRGAADIFGSAAAAGSEEELANAPFAGGEPYDDQKPTGARNENSVLFSLDALKAGVGPAAKPSAPAPRGSVRPTANDTADLDDIMNIGGGSMGGPLFGMGANQALLAAPPPPPEPPPRPSIPSEMPAAFNSMPPPGYPAKKSNTVVFAVGGGVALLAVIAIVIGVFALRSGKAEEAKADTGGKGDKSAQASGKSGSAADEKKDEKPTDPDKKPDEPKPEDPTAAPAASGEKKEVTEEEKKRFAEAMKKKEEAAGKTPDEKVVKKEDEKVVKKEEPSSGVASFNKGAAIAALGGAAAQASGCKRPGGPTGSGKAVVTFAPSGRVTSANVSGGEFPGTSVGSCVAGVFRRAQVPAFSGDAVTVSKGFSISP